VTGTPKFQGAPSTQTVLVDSPDDPANESRLPDELLVRPELRTSTGVMAKKITLLVRNVSAREITLTRGMPIAHLFPVDVVSSPPGKKEPSSFNFGDSPVPKEWKERLVTKMMERSKVFSLHDFDVGCSKSTQHTIKTTDDKPFRERSRRLPPADVEALRQDLSQLKGAVVITE